VDQQASTGSLAQHWAQCSETPRSSTERHHSDGAQYRELGSALGDTTVSARRGTGCTTQPS
jgi:hypothetical protein